MFDTLPVNRLELFVDPANEASRRVADGAGATREGLRRATWLPGDRGAQDMLVYSLVSEA